MTFDEAKRRVCAGAAEILDNGSENLWLEQAPDGTCLSAVDERRMRAAFDELCRELRRRGERRRRT